MGQVDAKLLRSLQKWRRFTSFPDQGFDGTILTVFYAIALFESCKKLMLSIAPPFLFISFILNRFIFLICFYSLFMHAQTSYHNRGPPLFYLLLLSAQLAIYDFCFV